MQKFSLGSRRQTCRNSYLKGCCPFQSQVANTLLWFFWHQITHSASLKDRSYSSTAADSGCREMGFLFTESTWSWWDDPVTYCSSSGGVGFEVTLHVLHCQAADLIKRSAVKQMVHFHHRHHFDRHNWEVDPDDMHIYAYTHTLCVCEY